MKNNAFSLIELMVVVAIVALLTAVATPVYKDYIVKARVSQTLSVLLELRKNMIAEYNVRGTLPATYEWGGLTLNEGASGNNVSASSLAQSLGILSITYRNLTLADGGYFNVNMDETTLEFTTSTANNYLKFGFKENSDGVIEMFCGGYWDVTYNGVNDFPAEYLPGSCQCVSTGRPISTGADATC